MIDAVEPWSGYYEAYPMLWATAHTTQFAQPGWMYLGGSGCGTLDGGGTYVTIFDADSGNYSIVIETYGAAGEQTLTMKLSNLSTGTKKVWRTCGTDSSSWFVKDAVDLPAGNMFDITVQPNSIVTVTTTTGQQKEAYPVPESKSFPFPYSENFENYGENKTPRYLSDFYGYFEVVSDSTAPEGSKCLQQKAATHGVGWWGWTPENQGDPVTICGNGNWINYEVAVDAKIEAEKGFIELWGHVWGGEKWNNCLPVEGICFHVDKDGSWKIKKVIDEAQDPVKTDKTMVINKTIFGPELPDGGAANPDYRPIRHHVQDFTGEGWYTYKLQFEGNNIKAYINGRLIAHITDPGPVCNDKGMIGLGCSRSSVKFDRLVIEHIRG